ncbi:MAG: cyclodeaminase/cyclohydrolase family protein [Thermoleophilaceae bacterium]|nr:cyclodeaminase/cyclohydrolase family protein [Thermoleophilaceae bacterium]
MGDLGDRPLAGFLDDVAAATPAPGGGTSAALTTALGAALVAMSAGIAEAAAEHARAEELRARALELAEEELTSYEPVIAAHRLPLGDPERGERLAAALAEASRAPAEIAELAAETAELGARVAAAAAPAVRGDAVTGTLLAEAAASAAAELVETNLRDRTGDSVVKRVADARRRARRARVEAA